MQRSFWQARGTYSKTERKKQHAGFFRRAGLYTKSHRVTSRSGEIKPNLFLWQLCRRKNTLRQALLALAPTKEGEARCDGARVFSSAKFKGLCRRFEHAENFSACDLLYCLILLFS